MANETNEKSSSAGESVSAPSINRRSTAEYSGASAAVDRLRRMIPAREKAIDVAKTMIWVIPLTLIIWIYAEQEQVIATPANVNNVQLPIRAGDGRYFAVVGSADPTVTSVTLKLTGPQEAVRRVSDELTKIGGQKPIIRLDPNRPNGDRQLINVVDAIGDQDIFRKNGVTVKESIPAEITVNIDAMAHQSLPVQIPPDINNLSSTTKFEPAKVEVSGPQKVLEPLVSSGQLKVYADLDGFDQLKHPGDYPNLTVPISLSVVHPELSLAPAQVAASIKVLQSDVPLVINDLPIVVQIAPTLMGNYEIALARGASVSNVTVIGPQQDIAGVKNYPCRAILVIDPEDASKQAPKTLKYDLPPNVRVSDEDAKRTVEFTLTPKN